MVESKPCQKNMYFDLKYFFSYEQYDISDNMKGNKKGTSKTSLNFPTQDSEMFCSLSFNDEEKNTPKSSNLGKGRRVVEMSN